MDADTESWLGHETPVVGMVHLPALPGAPGFQSRAAVHERAQADATALVAGGCDAVVVENFGDAPFHPETVPPHTVAELTAVTEAVCRDMDRPHGVNVLRNDAQAALSVAAATGGSFVRVNVHTGTRTTDQGLLEGKAHETIRLRDRIDADVRVLADVAVKHSGPVGTRDVTALARETVDRGLADGLVVSGPATGEAAADGKVQAALDGRDDATRDVPVLAGSGVTPETVGETLDLLDGAVVGTALKEGGETTAPVDRRRVERLVEAAR